MHAFFTHLADSFTNNLIVEQRYQMILDGLQVTLLITVCSVILGTLLGGLVCWMRMSRHGWLSRTAKVYIDLMRGTPVLVLLMLMYYVVLAPLEAEGIAVAIITFALNTAAYISEMLRTAIQGIDRGQTEAGLALGYTPRQTFLRIVLPQVIKAVMPVYQGEVISLLKGTSIVGYIAVADMTRASDLIRSRTFEAFFPLIVTAIIYFVIAWLIGVLLSSLVQRKRSKALVAAAVLTAFGIAGFVPKMVAPEQKAAEVENVPAVFKALAGKKVAVIIGSVQDIAVTQYAPDAEIMRLASMSDILTALESGKADVSGSESLTVQFNREVSAKVDTVSAELPPIPLGACFRPENAALQEDFNRFLQEIRSDGTYQQIVDRWAHADNPAALPIPEQHGTGEVLRIATFPAMPPFNFVCKGELSGLEPEMLAEWANRRNRRIEYMMMDFASLIPAVQTGKASMAMGAISMTEERKKQVLFSDGYLESHIVFFTRKGEIGLLTGDQIADDEIDDIAVAKGWWWLLALVVLAAGGAALYGWKKSRKTNTTSGDTNQDLPILSVSHLSKRYGDLVVLGDINFEVRKGEVISLIGPSGTGKSTLLRALNMLEPPTSGEIRVNGEAITATGFPLNKMREKIGMVFQSFNLFAHMTVLENIIDAPMRLLNMPEAQAKEEAMALLRQVGLAQKADVYPSSLSGGQKQRVAIARSLAMHPEVILFDEPTSALDPTMVGEVLSVIRQLAKSGLTMLIVTHEMRFARDVSTRIFFMNEGKVYEDGTPEQIFEHPVHSATKAFVQRIQKLVYEIDSDDFDYLQITTGINQFCVKYNLTVGDKANALIDDLLFKHPLTVRPLTLRLTHAELSGVTALDFMAEGWEQSPLDKTARARLSEQVHELIEEPTARGFRIKLVL